MFTIFEKYPNLKYGISKKRDSSMKLETSAAEQAVNRLRFLKRKKIPANQLVIPLQVHSNNVVTVGKDHSGKAIAAADGLVTKHHDVFLSVTVADCFPVYFFDKKKSVVAVAHCGWRGITGGIVLKTLAAMKSKPADVLVGIGPGIQNCHFEVKHDVLKKFSEFPGAVIERNKKTYINLPKIIIAQLRNAGVKGKNIAKVGDCTYCLTEKYFSNRRDQPKVIEAMIAYIGVKS